MSLDLKVLLVDDSGTMRTIQKRCMIKLGISECNITEAENGQEALNAFQAGSFDVIISDWNMPVMDGLALLRNIRRIDTAIPIVMVTTEAERSRVLTAIQAGVSDYLVKPFTADALKEKLEKWVNLQV